MLNKHNLNIAKCCSPKTGGATTGILVTPERTVASDGHKLITITTPKADPEDYPMVQNAPGAVTRTFTPFILQKSDALNIAKAIPNGKLKLPILGHAAIYSKSDENATAFIGVTNLDTAQMFTPCKMDASYPNWERVIPKQEDATLTIAIDARLIRDLMTQYIDAVADKTCPVVVTWRFSDRKSAIRMDGRVGDEQDMTAVVMPYRID